MNGFFSVSLFSALLTLLRMVSALLVSKLVAGHAGPGGMMLLGQVQNLVGMLTALVTAPVTTGVVSHTARHADEGYAACAPWWRAASCHVLVMLPAVMLFTVLAASWLASRMFLDVAWTWLVLAMALLLPLSVLNTLIVSVINGLQQYRSYLGLSLVAVLLQLALSLVAIQVYGLRGAVGAAVVGNAVAGGVMLLFALRQPWFRWRLWLGRTGRVQLQSVTSFMIMGGAAAFLMPLTQLALRSLLVEQAGVEQAGYWQSVSRISDAWLAIITMGLSTQYLPLLARCKTNAELKQTIFRVTVRVMPLVIVLAGLVYVCRDFLLLMLYAPPFVAARDFFAWQLTGDVLKIFSWCLAYVLTVRGMVRLFVVLELLFSVIQIGSAHLLVPYLGAVGVSAAYAFSYFIYAVLVMLALGRMLREGASAGIPFRR